MEVFESAEIDSCVKLHQTEMIRQKLRKIFRHVELHTGSALTTREKIG